MAEQKFLPLLDMRGLLVDHAKVLLHAASRYEDLASILDAVEAEKRDNTEYNFTWDDNGVTGMSPLAPQSSPLRAVFKDLAGKQRATDRRLTAEVVGELWASAEVSEGKPISLKQAQFRVGYMNRQRRLESGRNTVSEETREKNGGINDNDSDTVRKAFARFRNVAHFVFVGVLWDENFRANGYVWPAEKWIGMALTTQNILSQVLRPDRNRWDPIRVPAGFDAVPLPALDRKAYVQSLG